MNVANIFSKFSFLGVVFFAVFVFLYPMNIFAQSTSGGGGESGGTDTSGGWTGGLQAVRDNSGLASTSVSELVKNLMTWMLILVGFIGIIGFIVSGILYLTAAGNTKQIETAKTAMTWSIVGVIVALMGYVIILAVDAWLGGGTDF